MIFKSWRKPNTFSSWAFWSCGNLSPSFPPHAERDVDCDSEPGELKQAHEHSRAPLSPPHTTSHSMCWEECTIEVPTELLKLQLKRPHVFPSAFHSSLIFECVGEDSRSVIGSPFGSMIVS